MSCMRDIRKRTERTDSMFEPLRETVQVLSSFNITFNETVMNQMENAEFKWKNLKKKMLNRREALSMMQQTEAIEVGGGSHPSVRQCLGISNVLPALMSEIGWPNALTFIALSAAARACADACSRQLVAFVPVVYPNSLMSPSPRYPCLHRLASSGPPLITPMPLLLQVRRTSDAFAARVEDYRNFFNKRAPFGIQTEEGKKPELKIGHVKPAYEVLDGFHHGTVDGYVSVQDIIAESKGLQEAQELFELFVSDYIMLKRCNEELLYLKAVWDTAAVVQYTFVNWYKTQWDKINVEFLMEETKKLSKDVKTLNKAVRRWAKAKQKCSSCCVALIRLIPLLVHLPGFLCLDICCCTARPGTCSSSSNYLPDGHPAALSAEPAFLPCP